MGKKWSPEQKDKARQRMLALWESRKKRFEKNQKIKKGLILGNFGLGVIASASLPLAIIYSNQNNDKAKEINNLKDYSKDANARINELLKQNTNLKALANKRLIQVQNLNQQIADLEDEIEENKEFNEIIINGHKKQINELLKQFEKRFVHKINALSKTNKKLTKEVANL